MIARRFPAYDLEVQTYIARDPLRTPRLVLAVALAGFTADGPVPLYLAHSLGGGAEHALQEEIAQRTRLGQSAMVLRVGGAARFQFELHTSDGVIAATTNDLSSVQAMLATVPALDIIYSCGVGHPDPAALPDILLSLGRGDGRDRFAARVHDFFMLSPSYNLLGSDGRYRGAVAGTSQDPAHCVRAADGQVVTLGQWRRRWAGFLEKCHEITVFSQSSADLMQAGFPDWLSERVHCRPHKISASVLQVDTSQAHSTVIGVLGNLNRAKGADLICEIGQHLLREATGHKVVLIGNIDPAFSLPPSVTLHGSYQIDEIAALAERYHVGRWLVPSVWPETFSFATHEVIATGLPVFGFDIGAQGEALRAAPNGHPIPFDPDGDLVAAVLQAIAHHDRADAG
ncbi:glycosyltransferase [Roseicyclus elongatus]|uniref:glycosyltransferase n=1 Tax=Roseicyclus elongatus TaxID=159346 RepID=UPI0004AE9773|nr:glycosyltransferase [Roseibacterium elongatum]